MKYIPRTLIGTITDQATRTYEGDVINYETFDQWEKHWFAVAETIRAAFEEEGLTETVEAIEKIIREQRAISDSVKESAISVLTHVAELG